MQHLSMHFSTLCTCFGCFLCIFFFFFNDTATTEIYTLSLHDALPICTRSRSSAVYVTTGLRTLIDGVVTTTSSDARDRKSTRLNSSHGYISYAVFCLKKKKNRFRATARQHASSRCIPHVNTALVTNSH